LELEAIAMRILKSLFIALLLLITLSPNGYALGGGGTKTPPPASQTDSDYRAGKKAVKAKNWTSAISYLEKSVQKYPQHADAWNYLGYSYRKNGNLDKAFPAYEKALALDPKHLGAHEYLGEAYLQAGKLPQAQEQLDQLMQLCGRNCEETKDLQKAIASYKSQKNL
jgi:cytochrome c-type biogenesis protein CcmH/NrfG